MDRLVAAVAGGGGGAEGGRFCSAEVVVYSQGRRHNPETRMYPKYMGDSIQKCHWQSEDPYSKGVDVLLIPQNLA